MRPRSRYPSDRRSSRPSKSSPATTLPLSHQQIADLPALLTAREYQAVAHRGRTSTCSGIRSGAIPVVRFGVRPIKFHGMRHTCATLAIQEGIPAKDVQTRLGHKKITTTPDIYAHTLPADDQETADRVGALIHGTAKR